MRTHPHYRPLRGTSLLLGMMSAGTAEDLLLFSRTRITFSGAKLLLDLAQGSAHRLISCSLMLDLIKQAPLTTGKVVRG